jgi:hypothetical protein
MHVVAAVFIISLAAAQILPAQTMSVELTSPANKSQFAECSDIVFAANVQITQGEVRNVGFYENGVSFGSDSRAPYEFTWKGVPAGFYEIKAKVTDKSSNSAWSNPIFVFVGEAEVGNRITNGEFMCKQAPWNLTTQGGAKATFEIDPEAWIADSAAALITIENGGTALWHVQLQQQLPLDSAHTYIFSFVAFALEPKEIEVAIQENGDDWTVYFSTGNVAIDQAQEYGPFVFDCQVNDPYAYIRFNVANNTVPIYIDQVKFIDPSVSAVQKGTPPAIQTVSPDWAALHPNFPNPFNSSTTIRYALERDADVRLDIMDVQGRVVDTLVRDRESAGDHAVVWGGLDRRLEPVPSGVYVYRLTARAQGIQRTLTRKLLLVD